MHDAAFQRSRDGARRVIWKAAVEFGHTDFRVAM